MNSNLNQFGQMIIERVRDKTIESFYSILYGNIKSKTANSFNEILKQVSMNDKNEIIRVIELVTDQCLFNFLDMIEKNTSLQVTLNGDSITELSDGLAGELYTEDGWIEKYSKY